MKDSAFQRILAKLSTPSKNDHIFRNDHCLCFNLYIFNPLCLCLKLIHNQAVSMYLPFVDLKFRRATIPPTMWSKLSLKCCYYNQADLVTNMWYLIVPFFSRLYVSYQEFTQLMYALLGNKRMPLLVCVYHAVRKTFDHHKEELKGRVTSLKDADDA